MKKNIILAISAVIFMAGCGGGGATAGGSTGGGNGGGTDVPVACTDTEWTPSIPPTAVIGDRITQTKCDETRVVVVGEKWIDRAGSSEAPLLKSLTGIAMGAVAEPNNAGGLTLLAQNGGVTNNKGMLMNMAPNGTLTQLATIDQPLNTTFVANGLTRDATHIVVSYKRLDNQGRASFIRQGYMADGSFFFGENNAGYGLEKLLSILEDNKLFTARIEPSIPLPAPYPFSNTQLMYQDLVASGLDITAVPPIKPEFVSADSTGICISDGQQYMQYDRSFNVLQAPVAWSSSSDALIHDMKSYGDKTYIAGSENGMLKLTQVGNQAFRFSGNIPVGTDQVHIGFDAAGNLFVSVGNRIGHVNKVTGEIATVNPPAVPANVPWHISGSNIYFVENGLNIYALPTSSVPSN